MSKPKVIIYLAEFDRLSDSDAKLKRQENLNWKDHQSFKKIFELCESLGMVTQGDGLCNVERVLRFIEITNTASCTLYEENKKLSHKLAEYLGTYCQVAPDHVCTLADFCQKECAAKP